MTADGRYMRLCVPYLSDPEANRISPRRRKYKKSLTSVSIGVWGSLG